MKMLCLIERNGATLDSPHAPHSKFLTGPLSYTKKKKKKKVKQVVRETRKCRFQNASLHPGQKKYKEGMRKREKKDFD